MIMHPHTPSAVSRLVSRLLRPAVAAAVGAAALIPFSPEAAAIDAGPAAAAVTGTHIRGTADSAFPITIYNRDVIESSGASTLQQFIQMIPQNFNGGASESTLQSVAGGGNSANKVDATGVNLRGLGNDATLVLINGHRVAPGNTQGNFVDLSLIPLYAVERVEVVTDGASAIYGSDAVGGVINIILGRNLEGAETRARYGAADGGSTRETHVGQTLSHGWDAGSALLIYDYSDRTPLSASSRSYTSSAPASLTLLPEQVRHGAFISAEHDVTTGVQLFTEATYSRRSMNLDSSVSIPARAQAIIEAYSASGGARIDLPRGAQLELSGSYATSRTDYEFFAIGIVDPVTDERAKSNVLSFDAKLDGKLLSLPAGDVRFAVGGQFREEGFDHADLLGMTDFRPDRRVGAVFVELRVPILAPAGGTSGSNRLELTLADRGEHYSDFGSTNNPQVGLIWRPLEEIKVRGTYGTSFRAPLLNDLNPVPFEVVPLPELDPTTGGTTNAMLVFGGNPHLKPEKARTWTAGLDFAPQVLPNVHASATYYDIRFTNVITDPEFSVDITDALSQEAILGPAVIQRNPSAARVQELAATPGYVNFLGIDLATVGAIVDSRMRNLSILRTRGLDLDGLWAAPIAVGNVELGVNATYIFRFDTQFTSNAPVVSILNTAYNPVDLRLRGRAIIRRGGLSVASFINYTDSYKESDIGGARSISSWTTVDATAKYLFSVSNGPLADVSVLLAVSNLFNRTPPFVSSPLYGINFDGANANALGRFLSIQFSKRW